MRAMSNATKILLEFVAYFTIFSLIMGRLAPGEGFEPPRPKGPQAFLTRVRDGLKACACRPPILGR